MVTDLKMKSESEVAQSCLTLSDPMNCSPPGSFVHGDSPGKNTGVGCHFLLQGVKVKNENEVAQSCPTPSDPMNCSLPGSSAHEIFQARVLEWVAIAFSMGSYLCTKTGKLSLKAEVYWECSGGGFLGASGFLQGILVAFRGREGGQVINSFKRFSLILIL